MNKKLIIPAIALTILIGSASAASAESLWAHLGIGAHTGDDNAKVEVQNDNEVGNDNDHTQTPMGPGMHMRGPESRGVFGTVTAISGTTITVQNPGFGKNATATTYTVNASGATIMKAGSAITVSGISIGDTVIVQGTVSGTTVTAIRIQDGIPAKPKKGNPVISLVANGQPIIGGKVTAVNGNSVTITNSSNVAYVIDVTSAKIVKNGAIGTASNISVGDQLLAQGTINGTAVNASTVIDGTATTNNASDEGEAHGNFFGQIGSFFKHIFGF